MRSLRADLTQFVWSFLAQSRDVTQEINKCVRFISSEIESIIGFKVHSRHLINWQKSSSPNVKRGGRKTELFNFYIFAALISFIRQKCLVLEVGGKKPRLLTDT